MRQELVKRSGRAEMRVNLGSVSETRCGSESVVGKDERERLRPGSAGRCYGRGSVMSPHWSRTEGSRSASPRAVADRGRRKAEAELPG